MGWILATLAVLIFITVFPAAVVALAIVGVCAFLWWIVTWLFPDP